MFRWLFEFRRRNPAQVWAWATYDFANSAFATTILAVVFNTYYAGVVAGGNAGVQIAGRSVPGASMFSVFVAASMIVIAVASPFLGAISDQAGIKRLMLAIHTGIGVLCTALLYTVHAGNWLWGGSLFLVAQFGFAGSCVFYNAMLLDIADPEDFGKVSGFGWAWGYIGGGLLLAINLVMLRYPQIVGLPEGFFSVQDCFVSVAIWWAVFSIPILRAVPDRSRVPGEKVTVSAKLAFQQLRRVLPQMRRLPNFLRFFLAYLLYNDGIETVIFMASIFASVELQMSQADLIIFFLMVQAIAFGGAIVFGWLADRIGNRRTILLSLAGWLLVVVWAWKLGIFGNARLEYWILGVVVALVMGGAQAASRSLQAMLIPPDRSAEFFSFFGISGKFASVIGPLVFGLAVFLTGSLRLGILSLIILFAAGFILLLTVNEREGREQALRFETTSENYPVRTLSG